MQSKKEKNQLFFVGKGENVTMMLQNQILHPRVSRLKLLPIEGLLGELVHLCCHQKLRIDITEQKHTGLAELWCFILVSGLNVKLPTSKLCDDSDVTAWSAEFEEIQKNFSLFF